MDSIPKNEILEFPTNILQDIRKEYDLDRLGRMDEAINGLDEWIKKQSHFVRRDFPRDYLERKIIFSAGSVERAKKILDRNFALKSLVPSLYKSLNIKTEYKDSNIFLDAVLPKLTEDYYRIYLLRNIGQRFNHDLVYYMRYVIMMAEYISKYDYAKGVMVIFDYTDTSIFELLKKLDLILLRQAVTVITEGYGMKIKGIHIVSPSKAIDMIISIFKQVLSTKLGERIEVHKNYKTLSNVVSKEILPVELGGNERSIVELHEQWVNVLSSDGFQEYFQEMREATTDERYRQTGKLNEEYMGIPGTFRTLSLD